MDNDGRVCKGMEGAMGWLHQLGFAIEGLFFKHMYDLWCSSTRLFRGPGE